MGGREGEWARGRGGVHRFCSSARKLACDARPLRPELAHGRQDDQVLCACPADLAPLGGSFSLPRAFGVGVDDAVLFGGRVAGAVIIAGGRVRRGVVRLVLPPHALTHGGIGEWRLTGPALQVCPEPLKVLVLDVHRTEMGWGWPPLAYLTWGNLNLEHGTAKRSRGYHGASMRPWDRVQPSGLGGHPCSHPYFTKFFSLYVRKLTYFTCAATRFRPARPNLQSCPLTRLHAASRTSPAGGRYCASPLIHTPHSAWIRRVPQLRAARKVVCMYPTFDSAAGMG